jgi:hypothetical protein
MVSSDDCPEILRLDDLEKKGWGYFIRAKASGNAHMVRRAECFLKAAHERGMADVNERVSHSWLPRK